MLARFTKWTNFKASLSPFRFSVCGPQTKKCGRPWSKAPHEQSRVIVYFFFFIVYFYFCISIGGPTTSSHSRGHLPVPRGMAHCPKAVKTHQQLATTASRPSSRRPTNEAQLPGQQAKSGKHHLQRNPLPSINLWRFFHFSFFTTVHEAQSRLRH